MATAGKKRMGVKKSTSKLYTGYKTPHQRSMQQQREVVRGRKLQAITGSKSGATPRMQRPTTKKKPAKPSKSSRYRRI